MKASWGVISSSSTSGRAVTACSSAGSTSLRLNARSPMARESASEPLTRPNATELPAFIMRWRSVGFSGLWSSESATASKPLPSGSLRASTARESPALPQSSRRSLRLKVTTTDVAPDG
eukprot:Amastigsp_a174970_196.p3 type:complete len:119 gc:universal Amastigsp_a174970_196:728-372(-)